MLKLFIPLLLIFIAQSQNIQALQNFDASNVLNKGLYVNVILSTKQLNLTLDQAYTSYCTGYMFNNNGANQYLSQFVLLTNFSVYSSTFNADQNNAAQWTVGNAPEPVQWSSLGTNASRNDWTWVYADTVNDVYAVVESGEGGDIALILNAYWDTRFTRLSRITQAVIRAGFPTAHYGYYQTNCASYTFDRGGQFPYYAASQALESAPAGEPPATSEPTTTEPVTTEPTTTQTEEEENTENQGARFL